MLSNCIRRRHICTFQSACGTKLDYSTTREIPESRTEERETNRHYREGSQRWLPNTSQNRPGIRISKQNCSVRIFLRFCMDRVHRTKPQYTSVRMYLCPLARSQAEAKPQRGSQNLTAQGTVLHATEPKIKIKINGNSFLRGHAYGLLVLDTAVPHWCFTFHFSRWLWSGTLLHFN